MEAQQTQMGSINPMPGKKEKNKVHSNTRTVENSDSGASLQKLCNPVSAKIRVSMNRQQIAADEKKEAE